MRTLTEKYRAVQEGRFAKAQFLRDARLDQPQLISQHNSYNDAVQILKNRGLLFEAEALPVYRPTIVQPEDQFSIDSVERGIDVEIEKMGVLVPMIPDEEEYDKAKATTLKNLLKNPNFYIDKLAGVKSTADKKDAMKPVQGNKPVDKDNGMVKVQLKEAVKKLIYKALNTTPVLLKEEQEDVFSAGFDPKLAFALHKAIIRTLRKTGNTFEQEWPLTTAFGYFVNNVMKGQTNENTDQYENDTVNQAKEALENLLDPETLANPELMNQFLENLRNEFMTGGELFNDEERIGESSKIIKRRITSEGSIK
jgi:hypothetical protein